jgi:hypothetical protein
MTQIEVPRPSAGDVVELILDDHRLFESLMRQLRDETQDRAAARDALAAVLVAHSEAEEQHVYPSLVRQDAIESDDARHGAHEHDEANAALLALLEVADTESPEFGDAVEELTKALAHHLDEEEREILNPARTEVADEVRAELGENYARERARQLDASCGDLQNVRQLVDAATG